ncbi:MAG TPA: diguanylate cyclase [Rhodanobacter sp.]|nr:diguanylate cyclase [Rhodanobacter sp.]
MSVPPNSVNQPAASGRSASAAGIVPYAQPLGRSGAHSAFWTLVRRVTLLAAVVDVALLVFFLAVGSPLLGWLNLVSIAIYVSAYMLLRRRRNLPALILIWLEVLAHAAVGTVLVGWDSGFHYYLLMFIPAIVVSGSGRIVVLPLLFLFLVYLGMHVLAQVFGALTPLGTTPLMILNIFNVSIFFGMASYTARFYYLTVRKTEEKLRALATSDTLTGLSNRRHLLDLAQQEIARARRAGDELSLVLADIDHFKQINDRCGHDAGDRVLIHASELFREICRTQDIVARWGGEEFLFLLPATGEQAAREFAERVRKTIAATEVAHADQPITFRISMGVATMVGWEHLHDAIGRADRALYLSKSEGRDRVTVARHPGRQGTQPVRPGEDAFSA